MVKQPAKSRRRVLKPNEVSLNSESDVDDESRRRGSPPSSPTIVPEPTEAGPSPTSPAMEPAPTEVPSVATAVPEEESAAGKIQSIVEQIAGCDGVTNDKVRDTFYDHWVREAMVRLYDENQGKEPERGDESSGSG